MVKTCTRCLYTEDHPLGITFNEEGVCSGCTIHEEKDNLDWDHRLLDLKKIVSKYSSKRAKYDCIVPVCGAKDSFFILHTVINVLKLKPLVVCYNKYFNTQTGIDNLARLRIAFDVDFHLKNVNPKIVKKITKTSINNFGNPYWHCLAGETVFPVQTAVMMKIPLIIWGAHQGLEQVGMFSHLHNVEMSRRYRKDHDLFGYDADNFVGNFDNLTEEDVINYKYPAFSDIESIGVRGIYLGNFIRWDTYAQHRQMVDMFGYKGTKFSRTFDTYDYADSYVYSGIHDLLKFYKHGYSKVTDQACREIRFGRISRKQAEKIVSFYQMQQPEYINLFCKWLNIDERSLYFAINRHRNEKFWTQKEPDKWSFKKKFTNKIKPAIQKLNYPNTIKDTKEEYITIGKGVDWPKYSSKKSIDWIDT